MKFILWQIIISIKNNKPYSFLSVFTIDFLKKRYYINYFSDKIYHLLNKENKSLSTFIILAFIS